MHIRGQWGSKKNKMRCGDKFPRNEPRNRDFRGVLHTRGVLQNKYRGTVKSAGLTKQREFFLSGLFSRMLPLLARCIIVKMSNRFLRTRGGRRPRSLSSNAIPGLARFRFERVISLRVRLKRLSLKIIRQSSQSDRLHYSQLANGFSNAAPSNSYAKKKTYRASHPVNAKFRFAFSSFF